MEYVDFAFSFLMWLMVPAAVIYTIYRVIKRGYEVNLLAERGVDGKAWLKHKQLFRRRGTSTRRLIYVFKGPDGKNYKRHSLVDEDEFNAVQENSEIDIVYLPNRPKVNAPKPMVELIRETKKKQDRKMVPPA